MSSYRFYERWLHWLALEPLAVRRLSFDLERWFALPMRQTEDGAASPIIADPADNAVYICGLARSGTTMLLRILEQVDAFRTLTYRDMPFVLSPNLWRQIARSSNRPAKLVERAHGDGVAVDFDSPEAFEEVFWRTFDATTLSDMYLDASTPMEETLAYFAEYRALVANPRTEAVTDGGLFRRYLSKNNNNLLRLHSLSRDPSATILLLYRDPIATASSLFAQHKHFCIAQSHDPFIRRYMGWLSHHEFGLDHRPFRFALSYMDPSHTPDDPNYWLDYWNAVYLHVLSCRASSIRLVHYDTIIDDPLRVLNTLFINIDVECNASLLASEVRSKASPRTQTHDFCPKLLTRALQTYRALQAAPHNVVHSGED